MSTIFTLSAQCIPLRISAAGSGGSPSVGTGGGTKVVYITDPGKDCSIPELDYAYTGCSTGPGNEPVSVCGQSEILNGRPELDCAIPELVCDQSEILNGRPELDCVPGPGNEPVATAAGCLPLEEAQRGVSRAREVDSPA